MSEFRLILCTFPEAEQARSISQELVGSKLAACVNLVPGIESIYRWQGTVESSREVLAIFKTTLSNHSALTARLRELHPYEIPEIITLKPNEVAESYGQWVSESVLVASP